MKNIKDLFIIIILFFTADLYSQDNSFVIIGARIFDGELTISETNIVVEMELSILSVLMWKLTTFHKSMEKDLH